jgi:hypothetical protein
LEPPPAIQRILAGHELKRRQRQFLAVAARRDADEHLLDHPGPANRHRPDWNLYPVGKASQPESGNGLLQARPELHFLRPLVEFQSCPFDVGVQAG